MPFATTAPQKLAINVLSSNYRLLLSLSIQIPAFICGILAFIYGILALSMGFWHIVMWLQPLLLKFQPSAILSQLWLIGFQHLSLRFQSFWGFQPSLGFQHFIWDSSLFWDSSHFWDSICLLLYILNIYVSCSGRVILSDKSLKR